MPSLFSSRRRGSSANPPVDRSTSSAATAAAGQAFLAKAASHANLSSAAAAAALRSQTTSPELVANVQTKRMTRRASTSSAGSASVVGSGTRGGVGRGGLQRANSGGSMTERTFRSPSPGRQNSSASQVETEEPVPPVPALPNGHRRSASVEPPQRIMSPTPGGGKRGSSVDRASMPAQGPKRVVNRLSNVNEEQTGTDEASMSPSRNFSRPMSRDEDGTSSAAPKNRYTHGTGSWFTQAAGTGSTGAADRPKTSDGVLASRVSGIDVPLPKPRSKHRVTSNPGSHLSQSNRNSVASSEPSQDADSVMAFDPNTRTFITKPRNPVPEPVSPIKTRNEQVYDPHTRSFISREQAEAEPEVPAPTPAPRPVAQAALKKQTRPTVTALDTTLQPPPKNPARYSPSSDSPSSPRAMGLLHKQPSVVREDREGEEKAEASQPKTTSSAAVSQRSMTMPTKAYVATMTAPHQRSSSLDVPRGEPAGRGRNTSISPQRSTRFSSSPVIDATMHNPPGRDVSPVKSALKHSPASSVRANSPLAMHSAAGVVGSPSESDTTSDIGSQDGLAPRSKKSVRVSFDERAQEIAPSGSALPAPMDDAPSDDDAIMKPRPALPSFGSVRAQRMSTEPAEKVTEMPPDREGASSDTALGSILAGSLRGEGRKVERESSPQDPLPPEVTSREVPDYTSDTSSDTSVRVPSAESTGATAPATRDFALESVPAASTPEDDEGKDVPEIALQPPTPGAEDESEKDPMEPSEADAESKRQNRLSRDMSMPGGWGNDEDDEPATVHAEREPSTSLRSRGADEDTAASQTVAPTTPMAAGSTPSQQLSDIHEDSDDSAEFSDAAEDLSDLEDGGFASLDAMVEGPMLAFTPMAKKSELRDIEQNDESPTARKSDERALVGDAEERRPEDWGETTAYWSKLSRQQRQQIERDHMSEDDEPKSEPVTRTKKKKPATAPASLKPALKQSAQQAPPTVSMRKSMRGQPGPTPAEEGGVHMRRSMRSGGSAGGGMMTSMREGPPQPRSRPQSEHYPEPRGTLQKKTIRPASSSSFPASSSGTAMRQSMRPGSSDSSTRPLPLDSSYPPLPNNRAFQQQKQAKAEPPPASARLQKELSKADDSDSESSFRKQKRSNRAGSVSTMDSRGGGFSMRRSMRGGPQEDAATAPPLRPSSPDVPRGSSKWNMRSLSPNANFFGRNKQSVRASVESGPRTTLRAQPPSARPVQAPASRPKPAPTTSSAAGSAPTSRFKSRFASDSDDENDARPARTFRSRFADSDDEDDEATTAPANLTPVRGIPRRQGQEDGDSTDLESEEDRDPRKQSRKREKQAVPLVPDPNDVEKAMAAARRNLGISESKRAEADTAQGNALQQGSLRKKQATNETPPASPKAAEDVTVRPVQERKKRGFMGSILRRNRNSQTAVPLAAPEPASPAVAATPVETSKEPVTPSSPSSPTANKLRRSSYQTPPQSRLRRGDSELSTATAPAMYSTPPSNKDTDNWPLASPGAPPVPKIPEHLSKGATPIEGSPTSPSYFHAQEEQEQTPEPKGRPSTSDGVSTNRSDGIKLARTMRPSVGQRTASEQVSSPGARSGGHVSFLAGDEGSEPGERPAEKGAPVYSRKTGKKKKFGMLRRAFGLDD